MRHLILFVSLVTCVTCQGQLFHQAFNLQESDYVYLIEEDPNGNIWMAGTASDTVYGYTDFFAVKSNSAGDSILTRTYGTPGYEFLTAACVTSDGGLLLTGIHLDTTAHAIVALKVNANGAVQWSKLVQFATYLGVSSVIQTSDGGYLIYGSTYVNVGIFLLKLDSNGSLMWLTQLTDGLSTDVIAASVEEYQTEFVFAGTKGSSTFDVFIGAVDFSGMFTWSYDLGLTNCYVTDIQSIGGGNFILGGYAENGTETFLAKVNYGNVIWAFTYTLPGAVYPEDLAVDQHGNILMTGGILNDASNLYVLKIDSSGTRKWSMLYADNSFGIAVSCAANGDYLIGGSIYDLGTQMGQQSAYALRIDSSGATTCENYLTDGATTELQPVSVPTIFFSTSTVVTTNYPVAVGSGAKYWDMCPVGFDEVATGNVGVYPNPFLNGFVVECPTLNPQTPARFCLYDSQGKLVLTENLTSNVSQLQRGNLLAGVYFYQIVQDGEILGNGTLVAE